MSYSSRMAFTVALASLLVTVIGCSKAGPPPPLSLEQFPQAFGEAFKMARPEVKDLANEVVSCVQSNAYAKAYSQLQNLSMIPALTKEQSSVIGRGMLTVNGLLQEASAKGDESATAAMKVYKSNK